MKILRNRFIWIFHLALVPYHKLRSYASCIKLFMGSSDYQEHGLDDLAWL